MRTLRRPVVIVLTALAIVGAAPAVRADPPRLPTPAYEMRSLDSVDVPSHDGTVLRGWIASPTLRVGERAPVLLISSPYFGEISGQPFVVRRPDDHSLDEPLWSYFEEWDKAPQVSSPSDAMTHSAGFPLIRLIRRGYVVALFNVRGTGRSKGCFEFGGRNEQRDQAHLVEWLAAQPWSNGRVAMAGLSYPSWTASQAAVQRPPHLVATVTAGEVSDPFLFGYTPQGAMSPSTNVLIGNVHTALAPGLGLLTDRRDAPIRACPEVAAAATRFPVEAATGQRDAAFWDERRLIDRMGNVRAATLSAHGFWDYAHGMQDSLMWDALQHAPKRFVRGWWGHLWPIPTANDVYADDPDFTTLDANWAEPNWEAIATRWLDYWLKGIGSSPGRIGMIDVIEGGRSYELGNGWKTQAEVLPLGDSSQSFLDVPHPGERIFGAHDNGLPMSLPGVCPAPDALADQAYAVYSTPALADDVVVGGNPFAYLRLSSDAPYGMVNVHLVALAPDFACDAVGQPVDPSKLRWISSGAADLRYHASPYSPEAFPVGRPISVRVDLNDTFARIPAGYRVVTAIGYGDAWDRMAGPGQHPTITVHADGGDLASHIVIPVFAGTLGGGPRHLQYPPRPFAPAHYR